jgi:hypothetical protein
MPPMVAAAWRIVLLRVNAMIILLVEEDTIGRLIDAVVLAPSSVGRQS